MDACGLYVSDSLLFLACIFGTTTIPRCRSNFSGILK